MASLSLEQRKLHTGTRFAVQTYAAGATSPALGAPFVLGPGTGTDVERFLRVASLAELTSIALNDLSLFGDGTVNFTSIGALSGDVLRIFGFPPEWGAATGTTPSPYQDFTAAGVSGSRLNMVVPFWSTLPDVVSWELRRLNVVVSSGTTGMTYRPSLLNTPWRVSRYVYASTQSADALDHIGAVQAQVKLLVKAAAADPQTYLSAEPGNPISSSFTY